MLNSKKANFVIALLLATALWFYVVGEMNPTVRKTYRNVPVTLINEQTLIDNSLAVLKVSDEKMRITISGKRDVMNTLSKTDIVASCDLANAAEGENKLSVDIKIPENIEIDNLSLDYVTVTTENYVTAKKKVRVVYTGEFENQKDPKTLKVDPARVKVSGAESLVGSVAFVKAEVSPDDVTDKLSSTTSNLVPVNARGVTVNHVTLSETSCIVTANVKAKADK